jgi:hypothetical protein
MSEMGILRTTLPLLDAGFPVAHFYGASNESRTLGYECQRAYMPTR